MKKTVSFVAFLVTILLISTAQAASVDGYWRDSNHDGYKDTYVQPHERSNPNDTRTDNYNHPGNYNPNNGTITPPSNSPRENYPSNPSPYEHRQKRGW